MECICMFEKSSAAIKAELAQLKSRTRMGPGQPQQEKHYGLIVEYIQKQLTAQMGVFQRAVKEYQGNVQAREKRVNKYGTTSLGAAGMGLGLGAPTVIAPSVAAPVSPAPQFAMFSGVMASPGGPSVFVPDNTALRHRANASSSSSSGGTGGTSLMASAPPSSAGYPDDSSNKYYKAKVQTPYGASAGPGGAMHQQQQSAVRSNKANIYRLQQSEQIETSIARVC
jgi:hypothetical protein